MDKVEELKNKIRDLRDEIKSHGEMVEDAKCAALCETTAEVLSGLETAYEHYLSKSEKAWQ